MADVASIGTNVTVNTSDFTAGLKRAANDADQFGSGFRRSMGAVQKAADNLKASIDPLFAAQKRHDDQLAVADRLLKRNAISTDDYSKYVSKLRSELEQATSAQNRSTGSSNAAKAAVQNLGFQFQDFAVQVAGGTSVFRAFAQQMPQAAGALSGFQGKLGVVGAFLNGPWGIALTLATTVVAGFADKLFDSSEAADVAKAAADQHAAALEHLNELAGLTARTEEQRAAATLASARADVIAAAKARDRAKAELAVAQALLANPGIGGGDAAFGLAMTAGAAEKRIGENQKKLDELNAKLTRAAGEATLAQYAEMFPLGKTRFGRFVGSGGGAAQAGASASRIPSRARSGGASGDAGAQEVAARLGLSDTLTGAKSLAIGADGGWDKMVEAGRAANDEYWRDYQRKGEERVAGLASTLESALTGAGGNFWDQFRRMGFQVAAQIAARLLTNNGGMGGGFGAILSDSGNSVFGGLTKLFGGLGGTGGSGVTFNDYGRTGLPGLASGGTIRGFGGVDRNLLSINGMAVARVNRGEQIKVEPANDRRGAPIHFHLEGAVLTQDLVNQMNAIGQGAQIGAIGAVEQRAARRARTRL